MAKLQRFFQKIFGENSSSSDRYIVGFFAENGACSQASDIGEAQSNTNFEDGLPAIVVGENSPVIGDINSLYWIMTHQIAYLLQSGVAEWEESTDYHQNSIVFHNGFLYQSVIDSNEGNEPSIDSEFWVSPLTHDQSQNLKNLTLLNKSIASNFCQNLMNIQTIADFGGYSYPVYFNGQIISIGTSAQKGTRFMPYGDLVEDSGDGVVAFPFGAVVRGENKIVCAMFSTSGLLESTDGVNFSLVPGTQVSEFGGVGRHFIINRDVHNPIFEFQQPDFKAATWADPDYNLISIDTSSGTAFNPANSFLVIRKWRDRFLGVEIGNSVGNGVLRERVFNYDSINKEFVQESESLISGHGVDYENAHPSLIMVNEGKNQVQGDGYYLEAYLFTFTNGLRISRKSVNTGNWSSFYNISYIQSAQDIFNGVAQYIEEMNTTVIAACNGTSTLFFAMNHSENSYPTYLGKVASTTIANMNFAYDSQRGCVFIRNGVGDDMFVLGKASLI